ncbi:hypothetical protein B0H10DRAFT_2091473 [Mycena sp. CBHHK59/15]|nr:hypothetical protein B0H10DRAFT_2091473 [Mycena sp. CBHHK59/15]
MFKPGDKLNPYDPAALELGAEGVAQRLQVGTTRKTGETPMEQMMREKREWAEADAKSAELKVQGNNAFKSGDYKTAFVFYTVCMHLSGHEPLYPLNRAAASLKLKLHANAVDDASRAIDSGDFNQAKAHFRRGQARCFLGEWDKAEEDYTKSLVLQPGDPNVIKESGELNRLRSLAPSEQAAWIAEQGTLTMQDVFRPGELKRRAEEILGKPIE